MEHKQNKNDNKHNKRKKKRKNNNISEKTTNLEDKNKNNQDKRFQNIVEKNDEQQPSERIMRLSFSNFTVFHQHVFEWQNQIYCALLTANVDRFIICLVCTGKVKYNVQMGNRNRETIHIEVDYDENILGIFFCNT